MGETVDLTKLKKQIIEEGLAFSYASAGKFWYAAVWNPNHPGLCGRTAHSEYAALYQAWKGWMKRN